MWVFTVVERDSVCKPFTSLSFLRTKKDSVQNLVDAFVVSACVCTCVLAYVRVRV